MSQIIIIVESDVPATQLADDAEVLFQIERDFNQSTISSAKTTIIVPSETIIVQA